MNGFPVWTLWGMGLSALGALIAIGLALIGQSPRLMRRGGYRFDLHVRAYTGYGFALLLLAMGFFLAGVPIGSGQPAEQLVAVATPTLTLPGGETLLADAADDDLMDFPTATTPETGAFPGLPPELQTPEPLDGEEDTVEEEGISTTPAAAGPGGTATAASPFTATPTIGATGTMTPTSTPTPTPTQTPTPTMTPTPIEGPTAAISTQGSTVWVRRIPGGQNLFLVAHQETVILLSGRANQGGILWREISNLDGLTGWIQAEFLSEE